MEGRVLIDRVTLSATNSKSLSAGSLTPSIREGGVLIDRVTPSIMEGRVLTDRVTPSPCQ